MKDTWGPLENVLVRKMSTHSFYIFEENIEKFYILDNYFECMVVFTRYELIPKSKLNIGPGKKHERCFFLLPGSVLTSVRKDICRFVLVNPEFYWS